MCVFVLFCFYFVFLRGLGVRSVFCFHCMLLMTDIGNLFIGTARCIVVVISPGSSNRGTIALLYTVIQIYAET